MLWWHYLTIAIVAEVIATSALKMSDGFTKWPPLIVMAIGFLIAFFCLSMVMRSTPIGIIYAIWSGLGIVLITLIGTFIFDQHIDMVGIIGIALIVIGVIVIGAFSNSIPS